MSVDLRGRVILHVDDGRRTWEIRCRACQHFMGWAVVLANQVSKYANRRARSLPARVGHIGWFLDDLIPLAPTPDGVRRFGRRPAARDARGRAPLRRVPTPVFLDQFQMAQPRAEAEIGSSIHAYCGAKGCGALNVLHIDEP